MAGEDWWQGFRARHRQLISIKKPEGLSIACASCMNRPVIDNYFKMLEKEMKRIDVLDKPACVYNCDESGLSLVPETQKIVGGRGKRQVYQVTSGERGVLTTVIPCFNAAGDYIPPMIIFKGKRMRDGLNKNMPDGSIVAVSDSGYINKDLFMTWLEHFEKHRKYRDMPTLLVLDGHSSHVKALTALKFASEHNISIVCLPPHTTHWTQPLDKGFFKPLKSHFGYECRKFMRKNPGRAITRFDFGALFTAAYHQSASHQLAVNSFSSTGIYPLNKEIFPETVFAPAATTNRSQVGAGVEHVFILRLGL
jgi:DDE superfamily endonuclease